MAKRNGDNEVTTASQLGWSIFIFAEGSLIEGLGVRRVTLVPVYIQLMLDKYPGGQSHTLTPSGLRGPQRKKCRGGCSRLA